VTGLDVHIAVARGGGDAPFRIEARFEALPGITVLFGDSGAGKTTVLEAILGAHRPEPGTVRLHDRTLLDTAHGVDVPTRDRRIGIVFQDALLFPHRTARGNVAFGARDGDPRAHLERVGAAHLADRWPRDLSGGERQRAALARALAARPRALLLDEPFSSLDVAARHDLGTVVRALADDLTVPFVLVTHDLGEALRLGDHMVVLEGGRTVRSGAPADLVADPTTATTRRARGDANLYAATVRAHHREDGTTEVDLGGTTAHVSLLDEVPPGARVALRLRAEDVLVCREPPGPTSARNALTGRVERLEIREGSALVHVATPAPVRAYVTASAARELDLVAGATVHLLIKAGAFRPLA
jgi:molybdate transport system ATP-binding protein